MNEPFLSLLEKHFSAYEPESNNTRRAFLGSPPPTVVYFYPEIGAINIDSYRMNDAITCFKELCRQTDVLETLMQGEGSAPSPRRSALPMWSTATWRSLRSSAKPSC